jgi:hypothetical protein
LEELQTDDKLSPRKLTTASATRWGDQLSSVDRVIHLYSYVLETLLQSSSRAVKNEKTRIENLIESVKSKEFVFTCHTMLPFFTIIHSICLTAQKQNIDEQDIVGSFESGIKRIKRCIKKQMYVFIFYVLTYGFLNKYVFSFILYPSPEMQLKEVWDKNYQKYLGEVTAEDELCIRKMTREMGKKLIAEITTQLTHYEHDKRFVELFDPRKFPYGEQESMKIHGAAALNILGKQYSKFIIGSPEDLEVQRTWLVKEMAIAIEERKRNQETAFFFF